MFIEFIPLCSAYNSYTRQGARKPDSVACTYLTCTRASATRLVRTQVLCTRSVGKHSGLGGPQRLNRIDLYGKNLTPMEKLYNLGGPWPPWPPVPMPMLCTRVSTSSILRAHACLHACKMKNVSCRVHATRVP